MEQMRLELAAEGHEVAFVAINKADAVDDQGKLIERCSFPLLQDLDAVDAWGVHHAGGKDDIYVYKADGTLSDYFHAHDEDRSSNLSTEEGYANLKSAIVTALE